jgi:hypothetical protein
MKWKDRMVKHSMKDPVRGEFHKTGEYFPHPGRVPMQVMLTGVVSGPGIPPTPAEHLRNDFSGREPGADDTFPALIDRADPAQFVILWDEIAKPDPRQEALQEAARVAAQMSDNGAPSAGSPGPTIAGASDRILRLAAEHQSVMETVRLASSGEQATAVLTGIRDVPVPQAALPGPTASLCDLTLQVNRPDGSSYTAQTRIGFRNASRRAAIAVIGGVLPVRVDPADPARVAIDIPAVDAEHPSDE